MRSKRLQECFYLVKMNVVRHVTAFHYFDVRSDEAPALAPWDQISVHHAGSASCPLGLSKLTHYQLRLQLRERKRRFRLNQMNGHPLWGEQLLRNLGKGRGRGEGEGSRRSAEHEASRPPHKLPPKAAVP